MDMPKQDASQAPMQPKGKSAPAALEFGARHGAHKGHQHRGRSRTSIHMIRAAGSSPQKPSVHFESPVQDSSSGLDTSGWSDSPDSSSEPDYSSASQRQGNIEGHSHTDAQLPRQSTIQIAPSPFNTSAQQANPAGAQSRFGFAPTEVASSGSGASRAFSSRPVIMKLPRADVLVIGGDLAYPNPSNETYEQRFFRPFEAALPPPPHVRPGRLVVHKPDLPEASDPNAQDPSEVLHQYAGPTAFAIPGNHDWIDGLETYTRHIQHKGWLGGWLLPQVTLHPLKGHCAFSYCIRPLFEIFVSPLFPSPSQRALRLFSVVTRPFRDRCELEQLQAGCHTAGNLCCNMFLCCLPCTFAHRQSNTAVHICRMRQSRRPCDLVRSAHGHMLVLGNGCIASQPKTS